MKKMLFTGPGNDVFEFDGATAELIAPTNCVTLSSVSLSGILCCLQQARFEIVMNITNCAVLPFRHAI
jgi:hypothetical protein